MDTGKVRAGSLYFPEPGTVTAHFVPFLFTVHPHACGKSPPTAARSHQHLGNGVGVDKEKFLRCFPIALMRPGLPNFPY
jgi:hypothetical protein